MHCRRRHYLNRLTEVWQSSGFSTIQSSYINGLLQVEHAFPNMLSYAFSIQPPYKHEETPAHTGKMTGFLSPSILTAARFHSKDHIFLLSFPSFVLTHKHRELSCPSLKRRAWYHPILYFLWVSRLFLWARLLWVWQRDLCRPESLICPNGARLDFTEAFDFWVCTAVDFTDIPADLAEGLLLPWKHVNMGEIAAVNKSLCLVD